MFPACMAEFPTTCANSTSKKTYDSDDISLENVGETYDSDCAGWACALGRGDGPAIICRSKLEEDRVAGGILPWSAPVTLLLSRVKFSQATGVLNLPGELV